MCPRAGFQARIVTEAAVEAHLSCDLAVAQEHNNFASKGSICVHMRQGCAHRVFTHSHVGMLRWLAELSWCVAAAVDLVRC
jgi:hypothetical protein